MSETVNYIFGSPGEIDHYVGPVPTEMTFDDVKRLGVAWDAEDTEWSIGAVFPPSYPRIPSIWVAYAQDSYVEETGEIVRYAGSLSELLRRLDHPDMESEY